ncbi:MAG: hypothetical protein K9K37_06315, partial [Desulfocapsa sp.]|nr:hypothetical protein [Desulfocapsa sp.]
GIKPHDKVDFIQEEGRIVIVPVLTLLDLRGSVPARAKGDFTGEREKARQEMAKRVVEEMS